MPVKTKKPSVNLQTDDEAADLMEEQIAAEGQARVDKLRGIQNDKDQRKKYFNSCIDRARLELKKDVYIHNLINSLSLNMSPAMAKTAIDKISEDIFGKAYVEFMSG